MSIRPLYKATIIGMLDEKPQVLDQLQALGLMHIIPLQQAVRSATQEEVNTLDVAPDELRLALHYLLDCPRKRKQVLRADRFDLKDVVGEVLANRSRSLALSAQRDALVKRIKDLQPWGNFILPGEDGLHGYRLWFYLVPNYRMHEVAKSDLTWSTVHQDNRHTYVAVIDTEEPKPNQMPVPRTHTGSIPLHQLENQLQDIEIELEALSGKREAHTRWLYLLERSLAGNADAADLAQVSAGTLDRDGVFAVQGWVDRDKASELQSYAEQNRLVLMLATPQADEMPPTLLQNSEFTGGGEEVVRFYQMPGYRSWDPSRVVFFSFAVFFALILSDAGYALLLGAIIGLYWSRMGRSATGRRLRIMGAMLTLFSLVWGVLVGSYFGVSPSEGSLPAAFKLFDMNDFDAMMDLSIYLGCAHLVLGNAIQAWRRRGTHRALPPCGWMLIIVSGLLMWKIAPNLACAVPGIGGALLILIYSGESQAPGVKGYLLRFFSGFLALTSLSSMFGDILSYLRLFALGLASASLAITFNQLGQEVAQNMPGIGLLFEALILLAGHLLNFVLAVVSGVIHGLRLNLIEFYNWSLSDEGYLFQPFAKREVDPWIT